ncbi:ankyrin repeat and SOCS box protein 6 [Tiliqua scincoides]|uniref:ankyrin repeat and SOCS box protein 6 n=1 Tax=Tiliqua scincoides TaxID=71010 RepID=UPI0034619CF4
MRRSAPARLIQSAARSVQNGYSWSEGGERSGAFGGATTKDGDSVFAFVIFVLGEMVGGDKEEAKVINCFCFQVTRLLMAHSAKLCECPSYKSLAHLCLKSFHLFDSSGSGTEVLILGRLVREGECAVPCPADVELEDCMQQAFLVF